MEIFLITFIIFLVLILAMAVGYLFKRKALKGSCGGISALGIEKVCDCDNPCDRRKAMMDKA